MLQGLFEIKFGPRNSSINNKKKKLNISNSTDYLAGSNGKSLTLPIPYTKVCIFSNSIFN